MAMRRALVISGGGSKGSFSAGAAWQLIHERGLWFDVVSGVSIGAINTAMLAQARTHDELKDLAGLLGEAWFSIKGKRDIYRNWYSWAPDWLNVALTLIFQKPAIYKVNGRKLIERYVEPARLANSGVQGFVGWVELRSGVYHETVITGGNAQPVDYVMASGAIPMTFPPIKLPEGQGVDGGVREGTPLAGAIDLLSALWPDDELAIYVLVHSQRPADFTAQLGGISLKGWLDVGDKALRAMADEVHVNDVKHAIEINRLLAQGASMPGKRHVDVYLIYPNQSLGDGLGFDPTQIRKNYEHGLARARELGGTPLE